MFVFVFVAFMVFDADADDDVMDDDSLLVNK